MKGMVVSISFQFLMPRKFVEYVSDLEKQKFVFTNGGLAVMVALFERIVVALDKRPSESDFDQYVKAIHDHLSLNHSSQEALTHLKRLCASEGGREEVAKEFIIAIKERVKDNRFAPGVEGSSVLERITSVERLWAKMIAEVLGGVQENWYEARVSKGIRDKIQADLRKRQGIRFEDLLTLGQCLEITLQEGNWMLLGKWFANVPNGFSSKNELEVAYQKIAEMRAEPAHGRRTEMTKNDREIAEAYLMKLESCLKHFDSKNKA
jgi:hypothetical protein